MAQFKDLREQGERTQFRPKLGSMEWRPKLGSMEWRQAVSEGQRHKHPWRHAEYLAALAENIKRQERQTYIRSLVIQQADLNQVAEQERADYIKQRMVKAGFNLNRPSASRVAVKDAQDKSILQGDIELRQYTSWEAEMYYQRPKMNKRRQPKTWVDFKTKHGQQRFQVPTSSRMKQDEA